MKRLQQVSPREAYAAYMLDTVLVDVRETNDQNKKRADLNNLVSLPLSELSQRYSEVPANKPVVFISKIGKKGREAAQFMVQHGYDNVAILDGGLKAWEEEGLPVRDRK